MRIIICVGLFAGSLLVWALFLRHSALVPNNFAPSGEMPTVRDLLISVCGYLTMLIGAVLGVACRLIIEGRAQGARTVDVRRVFRTVFVHVDLWLSMLASPLLYGTVLTTGSNLAPGAFLFFALQSGFSSYVVVNTLLAGKEGPGTVGTEQETPALSKPKD